MTEEHKQKIRLAHKRRVGKFHHSEESKQKMRGARMKDVISLEANDAKV